MKTTNWLKTLLGGVSALLGGVILASGADVGTNYILSAAFTNQPVQELVSIWGLPTLSTNDLTPGNYGVATTDGAGKIDGVWDLTTTNLNAFGDQTQGKFIVDISGGITSAGKARTATVKMNVKGGGYVQDTNGIAQTGATIAYSFVGTLSSNSSAVGPFMTNVTIITLNPNGTTNDISSDPFFGSSNVITTVENSVGYSNLSFYVNYSANLSTNAGATNVISQHNEAYFDSGGDLSPIFAYRFGNVTDTNVIGSITLTYLVSSNLVTNVFNIVTIGTNIDFESIDGVTEFADTNSVSGFDLTQMSNFISAYSLGRQYALSNSSPPTNFVVRDVMVSSVGGFTSSSTVTNINPGITESDSWFEVAGTVRGAIKAGHASQSLNGAALFTQSHSTFSSSTDSNGVTVIEQLVNGSDSWDLNSLTSFQAKVLTFGQKLLLSSDRFEGSFSGKGTLNHHKSTYRATLRGVGYSRGSSAVLSGTTGPLLLGVSAGTNVYSITNIAAFPEVSILFTNTSFSTVETPFNYNNSLTNVVGSNEFDAISFYRNIPVPPALSTNQIDDAIQSINVSGKIDGQKVIVNGFNEGDL